MIFNKGATALRYCRPAVCCVLFAVCWWKHSLLSWFLSEVSRLSFLGYRGISSEEYDKQQMVAFLSERSSHRQHMRSIANLSPVPSTSRIPNVEEPERVNGYDLILGRLL